MAKELTPIEVEQLPNGYRLTVYKKNFMYFDECELFEGLVYHAGMAIMKEQDKDVILVGEGVVFRPHNPDAGPRPVLLGG